MADTTISFRVEQSKRERLEDLAKTAGSPCLSDFIRALVDARLSEQTSAGGDACAPQTRELQPINIKTCPILKAFSKIRCSDCSFRKRAITDNDPGPPGELDI